MKKLVCVILAVLIIAFSTASCASIALTHFEILEVGGYDSLSGADHSSDIHLTDTRVQEQNVAKTKRIAIDGKEMELTYKETRHGYLYHSATDTYEGKHAGHVVLARFNRATGKMDLYNDASLSNGIAGNLSRDECLAVAQEYLSNYTEDVEKYTLTKEAYRESSKYYMFEFSRTIHGIKTCDKAVIYVTSQGVIWMHSFVSLGEMRKATLPPQEIMDEIRAGLDERLDKIYSPITDKYEVSYELDEEEFLRLADGSYALKYDYAVTLTPKSEEGPAFSELTSLLVRLS